MPSYKLNRGAEDIKRELAVIIRQLKDPRISTLISIVKADVSADLSYVKVFISAMDGYESSKKSVEGLVSATGFIRRELSKAIKMKKVPELKFIADDSISHSADISKILTDIIKPE